MKGIAQIKDYIKRNEMKFKLINFQHFPFIKMFENFIYNFISHNYCTSVINNIFRIFFVKRKIIEEIFFSIFDYAIPFLYFSLNIVNFHHLPKSKHFFINLAPYISGCPTKHDNCKTTWKLSWSWNLFVTFSRKST